MTSPTHDATALAAAVALFSPAGDPTGLRIAAGCVAVQGVASATATWRQKREEARLRRHGVEHPQVRWRGPRRKTTRPLRAIAVLAAATVSLPVAVALACARLPDQLEVGPIDHRKLTHYLLTAGAVIAGAWFAASELVPEHAAMIARGVATGFLMHLAMDGCTRSGVPLFWPVWRRAVHLLPARLRVRTGGGMDTVVMMLSIGVVVLAVSP